MTRWNTAIESPCLACHGWGFHVVSKDPDIDEECLTCHGSGVRPKVQQP